MANPAFERLVENLRQEQERFRQEREYRHSDFVRRMNTLRARHECLVNGRVHRLSLDGITVDIEGIRLKVREDTMLEKAAIKHADWQQAGEQQARQNVLPVVRPPFVAVNASNKQVNTHGGLTDEEENELKMKKVLSFDCRYPRKQTVSHSDKHKDSCLPSLQRGRTHIGVTAKQNFRRIGHKVNTVMKISNRRHSVASYCGHHQTPLHLHTVEEFDNLQLYKANTQLTFEESARNGAFPVTSRYPKLAIARTLHHARPEVAHKTPKQRLHSAVTKLESVRRFQINA